jgi:hypothetical protein
MRAVGNVSELRVFRPEGGPTLPTKGLWARDTVDRFYYSVCALPASLGDYARSVLPTVLAVRFSHRHSMLRRTARNRPQQMVNALEAPGARLKD